MTNGLSGRGETQRDGCRPMPIRQPAREKHSSRNEFVTGRQVREIRRTVFHVENNRPVNTIKPQAQMIAIQLPTETIPSVR